MNLKMVNQNLSRIVVVLLGILFLGVFAQAATFSVSESTYVESIARSTADSKIFTITNDGVDPINLTISDSNLALSMLYASRIGGNSITLSENVSSITDLAGGASVTFTASLTTGSVVGAFNGAISIVNAQNSSDSVSIPVNITVTESQTMSLILADNASRVSFAGKQGVTDKSLDIVLVNNGQLDLDIDEVFVSGSVGEIPSGDIDFENDDFDEIASGSEKRVDGTIDLDDNDIEAGKTYSGTIIVLTEQGVYFSFPLQVNVSAGDLELEFQTENGGDLDLIVMFGEPGENIVEDDGNYKIENTGSADANNIRVRVEEDLVLEGDESVTLPMDAISIEPDSIDLANDESEDLEIRVEIPDDQEVGSYLGSLVITSEDGSDEYAKVSFKVKVVGDVYIVSPIKFPKTVLPDSYVDVNVTVTNKGSSIVRNVKIVGVLEDYDGANSDLTQSSSTFLMNAGTSRTETLRFRIPEDIGNGAHALEITLKYEDEELVEVETLNVERKTHNVVVKSSAINPTLVECQDNMYAYVKVQNLGKFDERVKIKTSILNTSILSETEMFDLSVDEIYQRTLNLDISRLLKGNYTAETKVYYDSGLTQTVTTKIVVKECFTGVQDVDVKTVTNATVGNETLKDPTKISLGGRDFDKSTVYLGSGVAAVFVLIVVTLFFI